MHDVGALVARLSEALDKSGEDLSSGRLWTMPLDIDLVRLVVDALEQVARERDDLKRGFDTSQRLRASEEATHDSQMEVRQGLSPT